MKIKTNLTRLLAFAGLVAFLLGKSHAGEIDLAKIATPTDGDGIVVVSLSVSAAENVNYATFTLFEGEDEKKTDQFTLGRPFFGIDETLSASDGRWGRVIATKLKPGKYRFGPVFAGTFDGSRGEMRNTKDLKRYFTVESNKVSYLGNLDILIERDPVVTAGTVISLLLFGGATYDAPGSPHVRDTLEQDLKVVRQTNPGLDTAVLEKRLMRDERDEVIERTIAEVRAGMEEAKPWAKALWTEAAVLGYAQLPDLRHLRLPATLAFNKNTLDDFIATGNPVLLNTVMRWALATTPQAYVRAPIVLEPETQKKLAMASANRYSAQGVALLTQVDSLGVNGDPALKATWKSRVNPVRQRYSLNQLATLELLIGKDAALKLDESKAKVKLLAMTPSGRSYVWEGGEKDPVETAAKGLLERCAAESKEACWIVSNDRYTRPPVCSAFMQATGHASGYPAASLRQVTSESVAAKPWATLYQEWMAQGKAAEMHPRAMVWDEGLAQAFTAAGDCLSGFRAASACKAAGGAQCKLAILDDKLMD